MTKNIAVLGSTGSVGRNALEVIKELGPSYRVASLGAKNRWKMLYEQARRFTPPQVALADPEAARVLAAELNGTPTQVLAGQDGLKRLASAEDVSAVLLAITGAAALEPAISAIKAGKTLALANKEALVMAGSLLISLAQEHGTTILPVDSEHSAIFQILQETSKSQIKRIILTASGGPLYNKSPEELERITPWQALQHPTWRMGQKISIDSATLMNKALEIIEAKWLFNLPVEQISVLIHPECIVHSLVEFEDGVVLAQMSQPDMKLPIQYALTYPQRRQAKVPSLDLSSVGQLTFEEPDWERFPALKLGFEAARCGGTLPAVLSAADETAVAHFLTGGLKFTDIFKVVRKVMDKHKIVEKPTLEEIIAADVWAREEAERCF
jgi:1-deoxy-D-xylulose-5-phosphate reductoisomerase